jgi:ubiquinone/menaquinone biosynthesis C-methylase UbiE
VTNVYELLASEYYDTTRHPTCANFRQGSLELIREWLDDRSAGVARCEIGCGRSVMAEILSENMKSLSGLTLTDSAPSMLMHSSKWRLSGAELVRADASCLPVANGTVDVCVASLGDPYNNVALWKEMSRALAPDGYMIFTTPSFDWAFLYRKDSPSDETAPLAEFVLRDGRTVFAPSIVLPEHVQMQLIEATNMLKVADVKAFTYSQLPSRLISGKLSVVKDSDLPIVTGFLVQKIG